ncbi:cobalamin-binding protein [Planctomycetales bacterium]|nr:cobalamin-binding protein [Planctomycetales bacterium]GHT36100.1 cobalamin-binding protein [Planctomycetales bacterium]
MSVPAQLKESLANCLEDEVLELVQQSLNENIPAEEILAVCNEGMGMLGTRFDEGEAFIPDLMFGGMIMKQVMEKLTPLLTAGLTVQKQGRKFLLGTVQYDVHDIGKDITAMVLRGNGFDVVDLGVDVPPEKFAEEVKRHKPDFVGMSILLTTCYKSVEATMNKLREEGLLEGVKTCIGGAAASPLVAQHNGIDFYGKTSVDCVNWAKQFIS